MTDFDPDAYLAGSSGGPAPASTAAPTPVDQTQLNQFDPDDYLATKANDEFSALQGKYGGVGNELLAGAAGAARGSTFGLSDLALTKSGLVNPETLKGLGEANPLSSFAGNALGSGALIGLTGGAAAPVEAGILGVDTASVAAKAAAEALEAGATESAAKIIGQKAAETAVSSAGDAAGAAASYGARAVGWGAEGAAFGAGNAISDYALGDPNINASKVLSDVGMGALFGAGSGALAKGLGDLGTKIGESGLFTKKIKDLTNKANLASDTAEALTGKPSGLSGVAGSESSASALENTGLLTRSLKDNAPEIIKAGEALGIPITPTPFLSNDKWEQRAFDSLVSGAPTIRGVARESQLSQGLNIIKDKLGNIVDTGDKFSGGPLTQKTLGEAVQKTLADTIDSESGPINKIFTALSERGQSVPVNLGATNQAANEIMELQPLRVDPSSPQSILAKRVAKSLQNIENVDDLKYLKTSIEGSLQKTASGEERHMAGLLADKLASIENESIINAAKDDPSLSSLVGEYKQGRQQYANFKNKWDPLIDQLGGKTGKGYGAESYKNFLLNGVEPETLATNLFDKKFSGINEHLAKEFPNEFALLQQYQKQTLKEGASKTGELSPKVLINNINKMQPEIRAKIFSPDELETIKHAQTWLDAVPPKFNPSGTSGADAFRAFMTSPTGASLANARDFAIEAFIKSKSLLPTFLKGNPVSLGLELADKFNAFNAVKSINKDFTEQMVSKVKSIVSSQGAEDTARGAFISSGTKGIDSGFDKATKDITTLASNPNAFVQHIANSTNGLNNALPNITQSLATKSSAALQFLNAKVPRPANKFPVDRPFEPSDAQKRQFMKYYVAVTNPLNVLNDVKNGVLSNESMEAMKAVHPELLQQMQGYVSAHLSSKQGDVDLPVAKKIAIAKFLGTPISQSMTPMAIQSNQMALSGPQLGSQQAPKMSSRRGTMKALNPAERVSTQTRDTASDRD